MHVRAGWCARPVPASTYNRAVTVGAAEPREGVTRYVDFSRAEWAGLKAATPLPLTEPQLRDLVGLNERVSIDEVADVYLPLSRLLNLYVGATQSLHRATETFLGSTVEAVPYVIGIAGSVAVGKSTTSRILQALLSRWPSHPRVALVTTDGFLLPQRVLESRGLAHRKGFPESYDLRRLVRFVADLKAGLPEVSAPVYSHLVYDVVPGEHQIVRRPDIVLVEGLNVLQTGSGRAGRPLPMFVSDFFDFSIYVDAAEADIEQWYTERFLKLRETVFRNPSSYFHRYAALSGEQAAETARDIWHGINLVNLRQNILPTRERARLVLEKGRDHAVRRIRLKKH
ncbi:MAG: type I pantothenate kinase [Acidobacteria bacterium]|nr:type I pantothenate kinase [Acidobacteriota bacterium]